MHSAYLLAALLASAPVALTAHVNRPHRGLAASVGSVAECPPRWSAPVDGSCYRGFPGPIGTGWNWTEAVGVCASISAVKSSIASVGTPRQRAAVTDYCGGSPALQEGSIYWIGLWDPAHELGRDNATATRAPGDKTSWEWQNGAPNGYITSEAASDWWIPQEAGGPDNKGGHENCVNIFRATPYDARDGINDKGCGDRNAASSNGSVRYLGVCCETPAYVHY